VYLILISFRFSPYSASAKKYKSSVGTNARPQMESDHDADHEDSDETDDFVSAKHGNFAAYLKFI